MTTMTTMTTKTTMTTMTTKTTMATMTTRNMATPQSMNRISEKMPGAVGGGEAEADVV